MADDRFTIGGVIGTGRFGPVYRATDHKEGREVALTPLHADGLAEIAPMVEWMSGLHHPFVARLYGVIETPLGPCRMVDLVLGTDVGTLRARGGPFALADACEVGRKLAKALGTVGERARQDKGFRVVHGHLETAHVMLTGDGELKLLGMGFKEGARPSGAARPVNARNDGEELALLFLELVADDEGQAPELSPELRGVLDLALAGQVDAAALEPIFERARDAAGKSDLAALAQRPESEVAGDPPSVNTWEGRRWEDDPTEAPAPSLVVRAGEGFREEVVTPEWAQDPPSAEFPIVAHEPDSSEVRHFDASSGEGVDDEPSVDDEIESALGAAPTETVDAEDAAPPPARGSWGLLVVLVVLVGLGVAWWVRSPVSGTPTDSRRPVGSIGSAAPSAPVGTATGEPTESPAPAVPASGAPPDPAPAPPTPPEAPVDPAPAKAAPAPAKAPSTKPAPATQPKKPAPPKPAAAAPKPSNTTTGTVRVEGDAVSVSLSAGGVRHEPGALQPGTYAIEAVFAEGGEPREVGRLDVTAGKTATVRCKRSFQMCTVQ